MKKFLLFLIALLISVNAHATSCTIPYENELTGGFIFAAHWNANFSAISSCLNNQTLDGTTNIAIGGIQTANIANLAVTDGKIAGITTAGKVNGSALIGLGNIPSGSGTIPTVNLGSNTANAFDFLRGDQTWNNPFAYYVKVSETESSGTAGGQATSGSWQTRVLNTKDSDPASIATLSSNQVTLPAGTYLVEASAPFFITNSFQLRLQNITTSATLLIGQVGYANGTVTAVGTLVGYITLSGTSALAIQYQVGQSNATTDLGRPGSFGTEVYTVVEFQRVA